MTAVISSITTPYTQIVKYRLFLIKRWLSPGGVASEKYEGFFESVCFIKSFLKTRKTGEINFYYYKIFRKSLQVEVRKKKLKKSKNMLAFS